MTKKDYELIESILKSHIQVVMSRPMGEKGTYSKVDLQDLIHDFCKHLEANDPKFKRSDFVWKSGALEWLQNSG